MSGLMGVGGIGSSLKAGSGQNQSLRVSSSSPAFDEGKIFRAFWELNLESGSIRVFKFEIIGDIILLSSSIDIDDGGIEYRVYAGGVESGTFTPITTYRSNNMSGVGTTTSNVILSTGGQLDVTGVASNDLVRVRAANANSKQSTVGTFVDDERGFPATTAYVVVKPLAGVSGSSTGTIKWLWRNR